MSRYCDVSDLRAALEEVTPPAPHLRHIVMAAVRDHGRQHRRRPVPRRLVPAGGAVVLAAVLIGVIGLTLVARLGPSRAVTAAAPAPLRLPAVSGYDVEEDDALSLGAAPSATDAWVVQRHSPGYFARPGQTFGVVWHTTDGGRTWTQGLRFDGEYDWMRFSADGRRGVVWGATERVPPCTRLPGDCSKAPPTAPALVYRTDDGGDHWSVSRTPDGLSFTAMDFLDPDHGWAVLHPPVGTALAVYATADGGQSWRAVGALGPPASVLVPAATGGSWRQLRFSDARHGVFLTSRWLGSGVPLVTADGGVTWHRSDLPAPPGLGRRGGEIGTPAISADGTGLLVATITGPVGGEPLPFDLGTRPSWAGGDDWHGAFYLYSTADHGVTWSRPRPALAPSMTSKGQAYERVEVADHGPWWVLTRGPGTDGRTASLLTVTADGGRTWTRPLASPGVIDLVLAGPDVGWAAYQPWSSGVMNLALTTDAGAHWRAIPLPAPVAPPK